VLCFSVDCLLANSQLKSKMRNNCCIYIYIYSIPPDGKGKGKDKAVPLQAWTGPEGSRKLRFPDFVTTAQDGGRFSAPAAFTPMKYSRYSFLLEAESIPGP